MILNLGCGTDVWETPGFVNTDPYMKPNKESDWTWFLGEGNRVIAQAERLPFKDSSFHSVFASHSLEHTKDLDKAMKEIHRVLSNGGYIHIQVPYGVRGLTNPFHRYAFDKNTLRYWTSSMDGDQCLQISRPLFKIISQRFNKGVPLSWQPPFQWHFKKYLPRLYRYLNGDARSTNLHVGWIHEIEATMVKV